METSISIDPGQQDFPNEMTLKAMDAAESGENMHGPFDSVAEVMEALNA